MPAVSHYTRDIQEMRNDAQCSPPQRQRFEQNLTRVDRRESSLQLTPSPIILIGLTGPSLCMAGLVGRWCEATGLDWMNDILTKAAVARRSSVALLLGAGGSCFQVATQARYCSFQVWQVIAAGSGTARDSDLALPFLDCLELRRAHWMVLELNVRLVGGRQYRQKVSSKMVHIGSRIRLI